MEDRQSDASRGVWPACKTYAPASCAESQRLENLTQRIPQHERDLPKDMPMARMLRASTRDGQQAGVLRPAPGVRGSAAAPCYRCPAADSPSCASRSFRGNTCRANKPIRTHTAEKRARCPFRFWALRATWRPRTAVERTRAARATFAPSVAVGGRLNASNRARGIFDFSNLFCQWSYRYCLKTREEMQDVKRRL